MPVVASHDSLALVRWLVPASVATVETRCDIRGARIFASEERSIRGANERRRREFSTGRACGRAALAQLGVPPTAIGSGAHGEPLWPASFVGSITHCRGYRGCVAGRTRDLCSVGIDAEVDAPLPDGLLETVAGPAEREWIEESVSGVCADRLLFSIKEALYKAWFTLTRRSLDFGDVEVRPNGVSGEFTAHIGVPGRPTFDGRWRAQDGLLATAVVIGALP